MRSFEILLKMIIDLSLKEGLRRCHERIGPGTVKWDRQNLITTVPL